MIAENNLVFNPDRDLAWYKIETPNNLISGIPQLDYRAQRYAARHRVEQKQVVGKDTINKKQKSRS